MLIDTGASCTVIDRRLASDLNLKKIPINAPIYAHRRMVNSPCVLVHDIVFGPICTSRTCGAFDIPVPGVQMIVGLDVLRRQNLTIDLQGQRLVFENVPMADFEPQLGMQVADVQVAGDLGVAHGTWTLKMMPRAMGLASSSDSGGWTLVFKRQGDGSWKWDSAIANSDRPLPGATTDGAEEKALIQIEQDWAQALEKSDAAGFEKHLAKEWTYTADGQVMSRAQMLADMRVGAYKIESAQMTELEPHVFGDVAVVAMTAIIKGKYKGADFPSPVRSTDFFVKRDGEWQAVSTQNVTVK